MTLSSAPLGHKLVGSGSRQVIVLNDWLCDTSTWDGAHVYLDRERFTYAFADLRGYGRSRGRVGTFTLLEAATDVLSLANGLGWARFAIVGHSMSSLIALHLAQHHAPPIERAVLLTPPPSASFGVDDAALESSRGLAFADDTTRKIILAKQFGRLSRAWANHKADRWRATADPEAAAGYVALFARDGIPDRKTRVKIPVLAVTGEQDILPMRRAAVSRDLEALCEQVEVTPLADSGHYPMQEVPPLTVAIMERFLAG